MIISYKFRAECLIDIVRLLAILPEFGIVVVSAMIEPAYLELPDLPDRVCTLGLEPVAYAWIVEAINQVPDSHVMQETLDYTHLYTGERRVPYENQTTL